MATAPEPPLGNLLAALSGATWALTIVGLRWMGIGQGENRASAGSAVVAGDTGVLLQNRGSFFSLDPRHPNWLEPRKRTFHTLIPAMLFRQGLPYLAYGSMGGEGQPQTQAALVTRVVDFGLNVQQANIAEYRFDRAYDLICMNQVVHDVWDRRAEVLARAREALREGGRIALWDRPFPEDLREVKRLPMHFMVFLNLFEEMGGSHLLSETEMVQGLREAGFADIRTYRVDQGAQAVVVGRK